MCSLWPPRVPRRFDFESMDTPEAQLLALVQELRLNGDLPPASSRPVQVEASDSRPWDDPRRASISHGCSRIITCLLIILKPLDRHFSLDS